MHLDSFDERTFAAAQCAATINRFAACLDTFDDEGVLALVTADCVWRGMPDAMGHDAIRQRLAARSRALRTLHVVTGTVVDFTEDGTARSRTIVTVYRFNGEHVHPPGLPHTIGTYEDRFCGENGRWRIAERRLMPLAQA